MGLGPFDGRLAFIIILFFPLFGVYVCVRGRGKLGLKWRKREGERERREKAI